MTFSYLLWYNCHMDIKALRLSEKKMATLRNMNINEVEDLLTHYPFRYEERNAKAFIDWQKDDKVYFEGLIISSARVTRYGYKRSATRFKMLYNEVELDITLFNRPWTSAFPTGKTLTVFGKYEGNYKVTCMNYNTQPLVEQLGMIPIYALKEKLTQKELHRYIDKAFSMCEIDDFIPEDYRMKYRLWHRYDALYKIHHPDCKESLKQSLRTLKYEEFLKFQLQMQYMKGKNTKEVGNAKCFDEKKIDDFMNALPFTLTNGQSHALEDILHDLRDDHVMYRLIQGDVGCGKTLVAALGMYACVLSEKQVALMVPTEILAKQHYQNFMKLFASYDVKIAVLYSSMNRLERMQVLEDLANGNIDMLIGTHALFQNEVIYHSLGMVVTDEQHRFGVEQRRSLLEKGDKVDFLLMSATPIPRTLAVSLYGDMEVSTIEDMPKGRKAVITQYIPEDSMRSILNDVLRKLDENDQCYIVCPAIEKNEDYALRNVDELYEGMNQVLGKKYRIAYLHGRLSSEQKDAIMNDFVAHKYHILISTTVIEVGVDVKDANIMVIYDAHRFGMSQIHQLRGRVGRGDRQGYCYLLSASKEKDTIARLQLCADNQDGFAIAKADLALRGPGDLLGQRQSGVSGFLLGDVIADESILEVARHDALTILENLDAYPKIYEFLSQKDYTSYLD